MYVVWSVISFLNIINRHVVYLNIGFSCTKLFFTVNDKSIFLIFFQLTVPCTMFFACRVVLVDG